MTAEIAVINPRTGQADYAISPLSPDDLAELATRMRAAQSVWTARPIEQRGAILKQLGASIARHRGALIDALTADTGRAGISRTEVDSIPAMLNPSTH